MEYSDVFLTLAEVSVAFAGFSGVVAIFGRQDPRGWSKEDRYRFLSLVETSLVSVFLAFLPFAFHALEWSNLLSWRIASGLFLLYIAASYVYHVSSFRKLSAGERDSYAWWEVYLGAASDVLIVGLNLYNLVHLSAGPYLLALILLVGQSAFFFFRQLVQAFRVDADRG